MCSEFNFDFKTYFLERERLRQESSVRNWIYIGSDAERPNIAKIGLTTSKLGTRASSSHNPYYELFYAFKIRYEVDRKKLSEIEQSIIFYLSNHYKNRRHQTSGRPSEWFYVSPEEMKARVVDYLRENFGSSVYAYHCSIRDEVIIYSWENGDITGSPRTDYYAQDLSSIPVDPNCYMPGGCGEECDCWEA